MNTIGLLGSIFILFSIGIPMSHAQNEPPLRDAVECQVRDGLPNVLAKWKANKQVRVAYLGGSITEANGWRPKTLAWFKELFPNAATTEIHAAIGGTGSDLGVYRLRQDVLDHKPDLLFVEFAVNDSGSPTDRILKAIEGIVRQTWRANATTDICFVYTLTEGMLGDLQSGKFPYAASVMEQVADHYGIPSVHLGMEVARLQKAGKLIFSAPLPTTSEERSSLQGKIVFSGDGVHPYPETGHELYLECIKRAFALLESSKARPGRHRIPRALIMGNWENAKLVPLNQAMLSPGWNRLDPSANELANRFSHRLPGLWMTNHPGETISLRFRGTSLLIYDLLGPNCGQVSIQLDRQSPVVQARFDAYCTYHRLATLSVADGLPERIHTVTIRLLPDQPAKLAILHQRKENVGITSLDAKTYGDTAWYVGAVLVNGDIISEPIQK